MHDEKTQFQSNIPQQFNMSQPTKNKHAEIGWNLQKYKGKKDNIGRMKDDQRQKIIYNFNLGSTREITFRHRWRLCSLIGN